MRLGLLAAAGWLVAAVLTVAASWSAVSVVRTSVVAPAIVDAALPTPREPAPATPTPTTTPTPTPTPGSTPTPTPGSTSSSAGPAGAPASGGGQGGTVTVRCVDGVPRFLNVTPSQGFRGRTDDRPGEVEFESDGHRTEITVTCAGGTARIAVEEKGGRGGGSGADG